MDDKIEKSIIINSFIKTFEEIYDKIESEQKSNLINMLTKEFFQEKEVIHYELKFILDLIPFIEEELFND